MKILSADSRGVITTEMTRATSVRVPTFLFEGLKYCVVFT